MAVVLKHSHLKCYLYMCYQIYVDDILFINMMLKEQVSLWLWESFAVLVNVLLYGSGVLASVSCKPYYETMLKINFSI